ncbi:hypothetical protein C8R43DRAFT_946136 [Mycena crocata]|nr:hypothetical protein C8R43DRAFT_946136 [Mycena crocata]
MSLESATPPGTPPRDFSVPLGDFSGPLWTLSPPPSRPASPGPTDAGETGGDREEEVVWQREVVGVIKYQKPARRRHRKTDGEKGTPGKLSWVWGTKLVFFEARKDKWLQAEESKGGAGEFYTMMARLYMLKYPDGMADDEDLERDIPDPPDALAKRVVNSREAPEVVKARAKDHQRIRTRVGGWYRSKYGSLINNAKKDFVKLFSGTLNAAPPKPGRPQLLHFYSRKFYDERIKDRFVDRMQALKRRAEYTGDPDPEPLAVLPVVRKEAWEDETTGFQEEVREALEREYKMAVKGWEASLADSPTRTPEEMAATLANAAFYLQPFVDAIYERFGMVASVLICGPVGKLGGAIGMQSVHSGTTKGLAPLTWPLYDKIGFGELEKSMVAFGRDCFSEAECRARAVTTTATAMSVTGDATAGSNEITAAVAGRNENYLQEGWANRLGNNETSRNAGIGDSVAREDGDVTDDGVLSAGTNGTGDAGEGGRDAGGSGEQVSREEGGSAGVGETSDTAAQPVGDESGEDAEATLLRKKIDAIWQRDDRAEWSYEINRAHVGFERGKQWGGIEWARCVSEFYNFEDAMGWKDEGGKTSTENRPGVFVAWFARQRQWWSPMDIGKVGSVGAEGTYADGWWRWWRGMQPAERVWEDGELSCPPDADWTELRKLHGKNGFVVILAALLWWGDVVGKDDARSKDPIQFFQWERAVMDVTWVLDELQAPVKGKGVRGKTTKGGQGRKRTRAETDKETEEVPDEHEEEEQASGEKSPEDKEEDTGRGQRRASGEENKNCGGVRGASNESQSSRKVDQGRDSAGAAGEEKSHQKAVVVQKKWCP